MRDRPDAPAEEFLTVLPLDRSTKLSFPYGSFIFTILHWQGPLRGGG